MSTPPSFDADDVSLLQLRRIADILDIDYDNNTYRGTLENLIIVKIKGKNPKYENHIYNNEDEYQYEDIEDQDLEDQDENDEDENDEDDEENISDIESENRGNIEEEIDNESISSEEIDNNVQSPRFNDDESTTDNNFTILHNISEILGLYYDDSYNINTLSDNILKYLQSDDIDRGILEAISDILGIPFTYRDDESDISDRIFDALVELQE